MLHLAINIYFHRYSTWSTAIEAQNVYESRRPSKLIGALFTTYLRDTTVLPSSERI